MEMDGLESSFYDYTKEWIAKVNRGGLFKVSNKAYCLFVAIENTINGMLHEHLYGTSITTLNDKDTAYLLPSKIPTSYDIELLTHIITL